MATGNTRKNTSNTSVRPNTYNLQPVAIENATIMRGSYKNFSGATSQYNRDGKRTFCVRLDDALAAQLEAQGWNVKTRQSKYDDEEEIKYLTVFVRFDQRPPKVFMISDRVKTRLNEQTIGQLDGADISTADIIISPYSWEMNGNTGVKAYLQTGYFTIAKDEFADKYDFDNIPYQEALEPEEESIPF